VIRAIVKPWSFAHRKGSESNSHESNPCQPALSYQKNGTTELAGEENRVRKGIGSPTILDKRHQKTKKQRRNLGKRERLF
jgi:hypothetical protein